MLDDVLPAILIFILRTFYQDLVFEIIFPLGAAVVTFELIQNVPFFLFDGGWTFAHQLDLLLLLLRERRPRYGGIRPSLAIAEVQSRVLHALLTADAQKFR